LNNWHLSAVTVEAAPGISIWGGAQPLTFQDVNRHNECVFECLMLLRMSLSSYDYVKNAYLDVKKFIRRKMATVKTIA
jgi:hypothetical protein